MSNRSDRLEIRAEPDLKLRLRYIAENSKHNDGSMADVMHRLVYAEFDRILIRQGHLHGTGLPPQVIRDWVGEDEDKAWAHLDTPPAHE